MRSLKRMPRLLRSLVYKSPTSTLRKSLISLKSWPYQERTRVCALCRRSFMNMLIKVIRTPLRKTCFRWFTCSTGNRSERIVKSSRSSDASGRTRNTMIRTRSVRSETWRRRKRLKLALIWKKLRIGIINVKWSKNKRIKFLICFPNSGTERQLRNDALVMCS